MRGSRFSGRLAGGGSVEGEVMEVAVEQQVVVGECSRFDDDCAEDRIIASIDEAAGGWAGWSTTAVDSPAEPASGVVLAAAGPSAVTGTAAASVAGTAATSGGGWARAALLRRCCLRRCDAVGGEAPVAALIAATGVLGGRGWSGTRRSARLSATSNRSIPRTTSPSPRARAMPMRFATANSAASDGVQAAIPKNRENPFFYPSV